MNTAAENAALKRLNRKLARQEHTKYLKIQTARGRGKEYSRFHLVDTFRNAIISGGDNVETLEELVNEQLVA